MLINSLEYALSQDREDQLSLYQDKFHFPKNNKGEKSIYLCGNSLGLQPKNAKKEIDDVLQLWQNKGVEGHFEGPNSWIDYNNRLKTSLSKIVGALPSEIAIANTLTVNLHLLMMSFYRPTKDRFKIIIEKDAFPSDKYVVASQLRIHGFDPSEALIEVTPPNEAHILSLDDFKEALNIHGDQTALVLIGGVNYITGQLLPLKEISLLCKSSGCYLGVDLAHAVGNVELDLHNDEIDFAAWCHYKYLNSGPGAIGGFFIHEKHHNQNLPRLEGWWGNHLKNRFKMNDTFSPAQGAEAWVMSTPPTLAIAPLKASLEIFEAVGLVSLREKSIKLTGYLETLILNLESDDIIIITPSNPQERGCQLSITVKNADKILYNNLIKKNVILDWREPNVIRVSPTPLYNSFEDVYRFVQILRSLLNL